MKDARFCFYKGTHEGRHRMHWLRWTLFFFSLFQYTHSVLLFSPVSSVSTLTHVFYRCTPPCDLAGHTVTEDSHVTQTQSISVHHWQHGLSSVFLCIYNFCQSCSFFMPLSDVGEQISMTPLLCSLLPAWISGTETQTTFLPYLLSLVMLLCLPSLCSQTQRQTTTLQ